MSLESWKAEYYPIPADQTTREEAVAHSLKKWEGLRVIARAAHGVSIAKHSSYLYDEDENNILGIDADSCALCFHAFGEGCERCPLFLARGGVPCDGTREGEADSPWHTWCESKDPEPMIHWLRKAQE